MSTDFLKNINYLQGFQLILSRFNNLGLITSIIPKYRRAVAVFDYYLKIREKKNELQNVFTQFLYYVLLNFTCATIFFYFCFFLINKFFIYFILIIEKNITIWVKINYNIHRILKRNKCE